MNTTQTAAKYAHFYRGSRSRPSILYISNEPHIRGCSGQAIEVAGLKEARRISAESGAKPWNF